MKKQPVLWKLVLADDWASVAKQNKTILPEVLNLSCLKGNIESFWVTQTQCIQEHTMWEGAPKSGVGVLSSKSTLSYSS